MTDKHLTLSLPHILLAFGIVAAWGMNFAVVKVALGHMPPLLFAGLRFTFTFLPMAFFLRRPAVPWSHLAAYGLSIGAAQFALLFTAIRHGISPGLASVVIQMQVFFTVGLAMLLTRERIRAFQVVSLAIAAVGLGMIVVDGGQDATPLGLALVLCAALGWALGNTAGRRDAGVNMLGYVVWSSLFAAPPLLALSYLTEGGPAIVTALRHAGPVAWAAVAYQAIVNSLFGYSSWAFLMGRYPAATVAPFSLLVPVFGLTGAALVVGEALPVWKIGATLLVMGALAVNIAWPRLRARFA
jgi:O-acetylserine/cysteine efflux transporter